MHLFVFQYRLTKNGFLDTISVWQAPETFRARKAIFSSSVSKNRGVYAWNFLYEGDLCSYQEYVNNTAL